MSGGHATSAGIEYQGQVGAWFASHILTSQAINEIGPGIPVSFQMESVSPVDDIVVRTDLDGHWFINVKTDVSVSTTSKSTLSSVIDQFVRQWIEGVISNSSKRAIDPSRDRIVLVVKPNRSRPLVSGLSPVIKRFADNPNFQANDKVATSDIEITALNSFSTLLKFHWYKHTGTKATDLDVNALLGCVRVIEFELSGSMRASLSSLLGSIIEQDKSSLAIDALTLACIGFSKARSGGNVDSLRTTLGNQSISLKVKQSFRQDIERLMESTEASLNDMARYSTIYVKASDSHIPITRECIDAVTNSVSHGAPFLVIGDPGAGKSGALYSAAISLRRSDSTVLVFQVDQLTSISIDGLQSELALNHPLLDILREWRPTNGGVLIIDALDASRGTGSEPAIRALITQLKVRAPHWTLVASIRKFDLRYGKEYQNLFSGDPLDARFTDNEFQSIRHINIPQLTIDEISEVKSKWPNLKRIAEISGPEFRSLLASPFNLYLLGRVISDESTGNTARTQLDLLSQFWQQRIEQEDFVATEESETTLENILRKMLDERRLTASYRDIPNLKAAALERLLHNGILYLPEGTRLISFSHHVLFDFALAKLVFLSNQQKSFGKELSLATDDMLLVAPGIMLALRIVWDEDYLRISFWHLALQIGNDSRLGPFVRALPSRVAAEAIESVGDVRELILALASEDTNLNETASFLFKHLLNVLLAGVINNVPNFGSVENPWCTIVALAAKASIKTLQWPINTAISTWIDQQQLSLTDQASLGEAARLLLTLQLTDESAYFDSSIAHAIKTTVKTFKTNPTESRNLLRQLIEPSRVLKNGHRELFWLANEFTTLSHLDPDLSADFLVAAFTSPLPSKDEDTLLGNSRILSLRSNKKQDFESVLYALKERLAAFLIEKPSIAGNAFRSMLSKGVLSTRYKDSAAKFGQANFKGESISFWQDNSCIWWGVGREHYDTEPELVQIFCNVLTDASDEDFEKLISAVLQGEIPAVILAACMRAGTARNNPAELMDLVLCKDVLIMMDTSYDAAQLLSKHFFNLNEDKIDQLQDIIETIEDDDHRKLILLSCIPDNDFITNANLADFKAKNKDKHSPQNEPHFKLETSWSGNDDEHFWLKSKGIDTENFVIKPLLSMVDSLKLKNIPDDSDEALNALSDYWPKVLQAVEGINSAGLDLPNLIRNTVCDAISEVTSEVCDKASNEAQMNRFQSIRTVINFCLDEKLLPIAVYDEKREQNFAESYGWGRPAPRIAAASALMSWVRAVGTATDEDHAQIIKLARDPAVEVRNSILSRANVVCLAARDLAKALAFVALTEEKNEGVISFFLGSFDNYLGQNIDWAPDHLFKLSDDLGQTDKTHRNDSRTILTVLILKLWLNWRVPEADKKIKQWIANPLAFRNQITEIIVQLRGLVANKNSEESDTKDIELRVFAKNYFESIVSTLANLHKDLMKQAGDGVDVKEDLTDVTRMLDSAATQLYHGSGAYSESKKIEESSDPEVNALHCQFLDEYLSSLRTLSQVPYPSVTHPVLEIVEVFMRHKPSEMLELFFAAAQEGGKSGGYHFESMGADLVVRIARKYLADYPGLIANNATYRHQILEVLNSFAEIGWPEARKLVYQLPEMLR
jgi:hypothetical protein